MCARVCVWLSELHAGDMECFLKRFEWNIWKRHSMNVYYYYCIAIIVIIISVGQHTATEGASHEREGTIMLEWTLSVAHIYISFAKKRPRNKIKQ